MIRYDERFRSLIQQGLVTPTFGTRHLHEFEENTFQQETVVRFGFVNEEVAVRIVLVLEKLVFPAYLKESKERDRVRRKWAEHEELVDYEYFPYALVKYNPKYAIGPIENYDGDQGSVDIPYKESFRRVMPIRDLNDCFTLKLPTAVTDNDLPLVRWDHPAPNFQVSRKLYTLSQTLAVEPSLLREYLTEEIDGREVFYFLKYQILRFADVEEWVASMIALWIMATHVHTLFSAFPYIYLLAERGSGKSRILKVVALTSHVGMYVANPTAATVVRGVELASCTLCIDEAEKLSSKDAQEINAALNAGYEKGPTVPRCNQEDYNQIDFFSPYSPKALASTIAPPPTVESRCLRIPVRRSTDPRFAKMEPYDQKDVFDEIHADILIWSIDQGPIIAGLDQAQILKKYQQMFKDEGEAPIRLLQLMLPLLTVYEHLRLDEPVPVAGKKDDGMEYHDERESLRRIIEFQVEEHRYSSVDEADARILVAAYKLSCRADRDAGGVPVPITPSRIIAFLNTHSPDGELTKEEKKYFNTRKIGRVMSKFLVPKRYVDGVVEYCPKLDAKEREDFLRNILDRYSIDVQIIEKSADATTEPEPEGDGNIDGGRWDREMEERE